jgi:hypothetical protein
MMAMPRPQSQQDRTFQSENTGDGRASLLRNVDFTHGHR